MAMIKPCTCKDEFQDKTYGKGMRVFNYNVNSKEKTVVARCTVCNTKRIFNNPQNSYYE